LVNLEGMFGFREKTKMIAPERALKGRDHEMRVADRHTVLRSAIYWDTEEHRRLAEDHHQQYLDKNPWGYCGLGGTGVSCPVGLSVRA
jgi:peptide methionine sulfoxide reductase MsrA